MCDKEILLGLKGMEMGVVLREHQLQDLLISQPHLRVPGRGRGVQRKAWESHGRELSCSGIQGLEGGEAEIILHMDQRDR